MWLYMRKEAVENKGWATGWLVRLAKHSQFMVLLVCHKIRVLWCCCACADVSELAIEFLILILRACEW